mgnify:CR=1 FL=1
MLNKCKNFLDKEIVSGGIFFAFGIAMLVFVIPATVPVSFVPPGQISPRFLPTVICMVITVIGFLVLLSAVIKRLKTMAATPQTEQVATAAGTDSTYLKFAPLLSMLIVIISCLLLIWVGFLVSSVFTMLAVMLAFGERRWWVLTVASIIVPISAWAFAVKLLKIPMP